MIHDCLTHHFCITIFISTGKNYWNDDDVLDDVTLIRTVTSKYVLHEHKISRQRHLNSTTASIVWMMHYISCFGCISLKVCHFFHSATCRVILHPGFCLHIKEMWHTICNEVTATTCSWFIRTFPTARHSLNTWQVFRFSTCQLYWCVWCV